MRLTHLLLACLLGLATLHAVEVPVATPPLEKPKLGVILDDSSFDPSQGVPVRGVAPGSSAQALGLQPGDLLATYNGKAIHSSADLLAALGESKTGDAVTIEVLRGGAKQTLTGKLLPPVTSTNLQEELRRVRDELDAMKRATGDRTREPTLAELVRELQLLQEQFPKAAAEFKKVYPNGEFSIVIRITSDKTAEKPVDLMQLTDPKAVLPETPAAPSGAAPGAAPAPHPGK
jgi:membrane-associated protease RseP (regulator of RpoE activity)